ncbi:MAG: 6-phosphogluconolactonase [Nitrospirota bacterium]
MTQRSEVVRLFRGSGTMDHAAAGLVAAACRDAIVKQGRFTMALSGGNTPQGLYRLLAEAPYRDQIDWAESHFFWADERSVPPDHQDSNFRLASDLLLSRVPVPRNNVHRIRGESGPEAAANAYDNELRTFFRASLPAFDLVLLGMGPDGHTASLFPSHPAVDESSRLAVPVMDGPAGHQRITMTLPVLVHASMVLFLVTGQAKAGAVTKVLEQGNPGRFPAGLVSARSSRVQWLLDCAAAHGLKEYAQECT